MSIPPDAPTSQVPKLISRYARGGADEALWARVAWQRAGGAAALYAATNLALALALTSEPGRAADLMVLRDWCARWLLAGERLYSAPGSVTDYPPNAVVLLAPLALIPLAALIPVWATVTALATPAFAYVVVNVIAPRAQQAAVALPMLLFLCWGGVRMLLQFTRVSVLLAFGAVWCADSRPIVSGLLLGVALIKPQIAGPIALWMLLTRRWRPLGVACGVVALGTLVYAIRVQSNPLQTIVNYASVLDGLYGDPTAFLGRTSIRRWIYGLAGVSPLSNLLWLTTAALLLLVPCAAAVAEARRRVPRAAGAVPALFCLWSLLVWFHLGNNLVLMFPAFAFLLLLDDPRTLWQRRATPCSSARSALSYATRLGSWCCQSSVISGGSSAG